MCELTEKLQAHSAEVDQLKDVNIHLENKLAQAEKQEISLNEKVNSLEVKLEVCGKIQGYDQGPH